MSNETISAFAFFTGKEIERIINEETNNLKETNQMLEALILSYRHKLLNMKFHETMGVDVLRMYTLKDFDKHFNISNNREGKNE